MFTAERTDAMKSVFSIRGTPVTARKNIRAFTVIQQKRHWKKPSNFNMKAKTAVTVKEQNKQSLNGWHNGGRII